jgi:hypothetical protein
MEHTIIWTREDVKEELDRISESNKIKVKPKKKNKQYIFTKTSGYKGKDGYRKYLKTDWWSLRKEKYWQKHSRTCYCCGEFATELHHNNYSRLFGELDKDFVPLCHSCHTEVHEIHKKTGKLKNAHKILKERIKK